MLTLTAALPLLGALLIATIGKDQSGLIKKIAFVASLLPLLSTVFIAINFEIDRPGFQLSEKYSWIPSLGINYQLGVDGISLILILLSTILVPIVILAGWDESENGRWSVKTFYLLILILETMMIGVLPLLMFFYFMYFSKQCRYRFTS